MTASSLPENGTEADEEFEWTSPDEAVRKPFTRGRTAALGLAMEYDLCVSGAGLAHLHSIEAEADVVPLVQVCSASPLVICIDLCRKIVYTKQGSDKFVRQAYEPTIRRHSKNLVTGLALSEMSGTPPRHLG